MELGWSRVILLDSQPTPTMDSWICLWQSQIQLRLLSFFDLNVSFSVILTAGIWKMQYINNVHDDVVL